MGVGVWGDAYEGAFRTLKAALLPAPVLAYPTREGHFTLSTDASDVRIGAVLEEHQDKGGQVIKRVIAYAFKTLSDTQRHYRTTNKTAGSSDGDRAVLIIPDGTAFYSGSLTWLRNFRELEGLVTWWIACLQPFDFAIAHHPGKQHSHADGLPWRTSMPCNRETYPECKPLRKAAVPKTKTALCYTPTLPYQRHFDGYVKMSKEDASLFWEMDLDPAPDHESDSADSTLPTRTAPIDEEVVHEEVISIGPVSTSKPDDSRRMDASATLMDESQDTKPVEPVHAVRGRDQTGAPADNTLTSRPLCLQATIGTQIDEMNQLSDDVDPQ